MASIGCQCHKEIAELRDFIKRWFTLLSSRFDDQDKNLWDQNRKLNEIHSYVCQQFEIAEKSTFSTADIFGHDPAADSSSIPVEHFATGVNASINEATVSTIPKNNIPIIVDEEIDDVKVLDNLYSNIKDNESFNHATTVPSSSRNIGDNLYNDLQTSYYNSSASFTPAISPGPFQNGINVMEESNSSYADCITRRNDQAVLYETPTASNTNLHKTASRTNPSILAKRRKVVNEKSRVNFNSESNKRVPQMDSDKSATDCSMKEMQQPSNSATYISEQEVFDKCYEKWGELLETKGNHLGRFMLKRGASFNFRLLSTNQCTPSLDRKFTYNIVQAFLEKLQTYGFGTIEKNGVAKSKWIFHKKPYASMNNDAKKLFHKLGIDKKTYEESFRFVVKQR